MPTTVPAAAATFGKSDTVYVSMWTANAPVGTEIKARWFGPDGKQFTEDKSDRPPGDGYTSFHAANTQRLGSGNYRVEILLNGAAGRNGDVRHFVVLLSSGAAERRRTWASDILALRARNDNRTPYTLNLKSITSPSATT